MSAKIGLTGGIGSGKSAVSSVFRELGIQTIDADQVARQLSTPGTGEYREIVAYFGEDIVNADGSINRHRLGQIVFSFPEKRKALESILHPSIKRLMNAFSEELKTGYCVLEIPLLIESGQQNDMDRVLVVTSKTEIRKNRLQHFRSMQPELIEKIFQNQISDKQRSEYADDIITNDSSINSLKKQVLELHEIYQRIFL
jgi:dephospho-CoA kinase